MRRFEVAPGIQITYNDLKMDSCFRPIRFEKDFLQINHCLEGCYECELESGAVSFLGEGDLCVDYLSKEIHKNLGNRMKPGVPAHGASRFATQLPLLQDRTGLDMPIQPGAKTAVQDFPYGGFLL